MAIRVLALLLLITMASSQDVQEGKPEIYVFENDVFRFGNGHVDSVGPTSFGGCAREDGTRVPCTDPDWTYYSYDTSDEEEYHRRGNLQQPFLHFGDDLGGFHELSYNRHPFKMAMKAGPQTGSPFDPRNFADGVNIDVDAAVPTVDRSGFLITSSVYDNLTDHNVHRGYGTVTVTQVLDASAVVPSASITLTRTYILPTTSSMVCFIQVSLTASTDLENVRVWYGIGDDYIGEYDRESYYEDSPNKHIGRLGDITIGNNSVTVSNSDPDAPLAAGIMFYSTFPGARAVVGASHGFQHAVQADPYNSPMTYIEDDNAYGIYLPVGTLTSGSETKLGLAYAAGPYDSLNTAAEELITAGSPQPPPAPDPAATAVGDPHFITAHGDRFDFKGKNNTLYNLLSHTNITVNSLFMYADFKTGFAKRVHGSFMRASFVTVQTNASRTLRVGYSANHSMSASVGIDNSQRNLAVGEVLHIDNADISLQGRTLSVRTPEWLVEVTNKVMPGMIGATTCNTGRCIVNVQTTPLFDVDHAKVAPHGLIGQSWDGDDVAIRGKTDDYTLREVTTVAMGEGAIEGLAEQYEMTSAFATDFAFSRFGSAFASPRHVSALSGIKATRVATSFAVVN